MKTDQMTVTILDDGAVKIEVFGSVSGPNHATAEGLVKAIATALGGETTIVKGKHSHGHEHHVHEIKH